MKSTLFLLVFVVGCTQANSKFTRDVDMAGSNNGSNDLGDPDLLTNGNPDMVTVQVDLLQPSDTNPTVDMAKSSDMTESQPQPDLLTVPDLLTPTPDGAVTVSCTPNTLSCNGQMLVECGPTGTYGHNPTNCEFAPGGTSNNPMMCATTSCPNGATACCRREKPLFVWDVTSPWVESGSIYEEFKPNQCAFSPGYSQNVPENDYSMGYTVGLTSGDCRDRDEQGRTLVFSAQGPLPGNFPYTATYTYTGSTNALIMYGETTADTCYSWYGTITWQSGKPHYEVKVDMTCRSTWDSDGRKVKATFYGDL